jgi:predicted metalloendopeptidase
MIKDGLFFFFCSLCHSSFRQYDKNGNLRQWWSQSSIEKFAEQAQCIVNQYSAFEIDGMHVNGNLTLGENIADNGGVQEAYDAYMRWVDKHGMMSCTAIT